jgi:hypothetical protein
MITRKSQFGQAKVTLALFPALTGSRHPLLNERRKMKQFEHFLRRVAAILRLGARGQVIVVYRHPPRYLR